jgi:pellino protein
LAELLFVIPPAIQLLNKPYPRLTMGDDQQNWRNNVAHFLAGTLPKATDRPGWIDMASTAYEIGCMALVKLGFADATDWGAVPRDVPEQPANMPRWDDICISVLWLANQQNLLSFRLPDGSLPPTRMGNGLVIAMKDPPPPPTPNITARFGLGCALCNDEVLLLLQQLGLVSSGGWTQQAEFILWRTSPTNWSLDFLRDKRFLDAVQKATVTIPEDIVAELSELTEISEEHIDELIAWHEEKLAEGREKYGPKARLGEVPTRARAQRSIEFSRRNAMDWVFFRRWRIDDGWLSKKEAEAALEIFHDRLATSMRRSVVKGLHPSKPQFFE